MKYPLDPQTFVENVNRLVENDKAQNTLVHRMSELLLEGLDQAEFKDTEWYSDVEQLLKDLHALKMYHESRRFNESNGHHEIEAPSKSFADDGPDLGEGEMTEEELARMFKEKRKTKKEQPRAKTLKEMTMEEIEAWESAQDNSNDIYKIKARIANLARGPGMSLTPVGEILCNSFVHVCKALYEFADQVPDPNTKIQLIGLIRNQEAVPGTIIAAAGAGVVKAKGDTGI